MVNKMSHTKSKELVRMLMLNTSKPDENQCQMIIQYQLQARKEWHAKIVIGVSEAGAEQILEGMRISPYFMEVEVLWTKQNGPTPLGHEFLRHCNEVVAYDVDGWFDQMVNEAYR